VVRDLILFLSIFAKRLLPPPSPFVRTQIIFVEGDLFQTVPIISLPLFSFTAPFFTSLLPSACSFPGFVALRFAVPFFYDRVSSEPPGSQTFLHARCLPFRRVLSIRLLEERFTPLPLSGTLGSVDVCFPLFG